MTVTYTGKVANAKLCAFSRLLLYWRGSVYKLMYKEMLIFIILYTALSLTYRFVLGESTKRLFEQLCLYCQTFTSLIPLSFVLGFYVAIVVTRWWNMFLNIPWPDKVMMFVTTLIEGFDDQARMIRRTVMRYLMLSCLIVFQTTSIVVKKRFPTMDHLIEAGIMRQDELQALEEVQTPHGKWWVPIVWTFNLIKDAKKEGRITDDYGLKTLLDEIQLYRSNLGLLYSYDWISIPLVYTQVTTLAVYTFFLGCVFGRQFLDPAQGYQGHDVDLYVPVFTLLQFFFYMGWLKVAEQMINPFGEDDDDFDMNWIIDRNMQVSLLTVDDLHQSFPKLQKDVFFDEPPPDYLAYTKSAVSSITQPWLGSTANFNISDDGMQVVTPPMDTIQEEAETEPETPMEYVLPSNSHLNVNSIAPSIAPSIATSPITSPHRVRKNTAHLTNNLIASLSGIRSTLNLSRTHLDVNATNTINIGYVQGIRTGTSRGDMNRLGHSRGDMNMHSSRDINKIHQTDTTNTAGKEARSLLQTLTGSAITKETPQTIDSPLYDAARFDIRRCDSITSRQSTISASHRPRSHCFQVEQVDESSLNAVQNPVTYDDKLPVNGKTNACFVIDMNACHDTSEKPPCGTPPILNTPHVQPKMHLAIPTTIVHPTQIPSPSEVPANEVEGNQDRLAVVPEVIDQNSSTESLPFIKPDSNQCTVTSLTPLLRHDSTSSDSDCDVPTPVV